MKASTRMLLMRTEKSCSVVAASSHQWRNWVHRKKMNKKVWVTNRRKTTPSMCLEIEWETLVGSTLVHHYCLSYYPSFAFYSATCLPWYVDHYLFQVCRSTLVPCVSFVSWVSSHQIPANLSRVVHHMCHSCGLKRRMMKRKHR